MRACPMVPVVAYTSVTMAAATATTVSTSCMARLCVA
jgi:hypothetical protein